MSRPSSETVTTPGTLMPPEATAKVIGWLAEDPDAEQWRGQMVIAPKLCNKLGLLPGWTPAARR